MLRFIVFCLFLFSFSACFDNKDDSNSQSSQATLPLQSSNILSDSARWDSRENLTDPETLYARCASCHGKDGKSVAPGSVGNVLIASLNKEQVIESLKGFRSQALSKGGNSVIMYMQTKNLSDADIEALGAYIDAF
ncbi:c-type cytochrome [uncultured Helicobacter sp.]|uniref:c-type cytochrome n=1 Tax=uncultured Helicobacter sp. TaxID=175537 RepID=UPI0025D782A3|nr:c-type cytochrome [uncultured Helicobacter sp.]